jgi:hypothetical protein
LHALTPADQPQPPDPTWPRYTSKPFPPYRYVPGRFPHPRRHPDGHSYNEAEPIADPIAPYDWAKSEIYLYAIDLYNYAYWWECHEQLEALWHAVGHQTMQGQFLQGVVQIAAANLHKFMGDKESNAGQSLAEKGLGHLTGITEIYMGIDVPGFRRDVQEYFRGSRNIPALIALRRGHPVSPE